MAGDIHDVWKHIDHLWTVVNRHDNDIESLENKVSDINSGSDNAKSRKNEAHSVHDELVSEKEYIKNLIKYLKQKLMEKEKSSQDCIYDLCELDGFEKCISFVRKYSKGK